MGPEITLQALAQEPPQATGHVIIGSAALCHYWNQRLQLGITFSKDLASLAPGQVFVQDDGSFPISEPLKPGDPRAGRAAMAWLTDGARRCLRGELAGIVTAPVNKEAIIEAGYPDFIGQTEYLAGLAGTDKFAMMLLGHDDCERWLRVVLATTHVPLRHVAERLTHGKITLAIEMAAEACRLLDLPQARIGVCGLNPHAGEGGKLGHEELEMVTPAVQAVCQRGFNAVGPLAADTLFYQAFRGDFEVVVAMYHDQGLAPLKMVAFEHGINWTVGLPFIRTSPDHGTAYNIAGQGIAQSSSMTAALRLARQLASRQG